MPESIPASNSQTNSLYRATTNIDDLTRALANFSRVPSPEPSCGVTCCCEREGCEHLASWLAIKSKLESRLILSAEVGQALLQKHEAYVRRNEGLWTPTHHNSTSQEALSSPVDHERIDPRIVELSKDNADLEKRLTQALLNSEVSEASHKAVLEDLDEAKSAISKLTAQYARSLGWDTRLLAIAQEKDDMQQERDSESQRARLAESRIAALKERISKLQSEVRRLQEDLELRRMHRLESSESILQEARTRLGMLQTSRQVGQTTQAEESKIMNVLQSLVEDNEILKHDNAELQSLLAQSREDYHLLQEEVEERRANPPSHGGAESHFSRSRHMLDPAHASSPSRKGNLSVLYEKSRRNRSTEPGIRRPLELLTPETDHRSLSHAESCARSGTRQTALEQAQNQLRVPFAHTTLEVNSIDQPDGVFNPRPNKALLLLMQSRGVQTDTWPAFLTSQPVIAAPYSPPSPDPRSESSSLIDTQSPMTFLIERIVLLLNRITQADAFTLTNRLKRQHLKGADVSHLSRSTIGGVVHDAIALRSQFRTLLEDNKVPIICTRKDLRSLFQFLKDVFTLMGEMRITLNDIILDPSIARKVSDLAMDPTNGEASKGQEGVGSSSWMAPIAKLFASANVTSESTHSNGPSAQARVTGQRGIPRVPSRMTPKLEPALSAQATTVNVEFSGAGVGRSVTSTFSAQPVLGGDYVPLTTTTSPSLLASDNLSRNVMDIFAGAPRSINTPDAWVKVEPPRGHQRIQLVQRLNRTTTLGRGTVRHGGNLNNGVSRNVDAVIDVEPSRGGGEEDSLGPLLQHTTLRRRGLSDSSIHSTFNSQSGEPERASHLMTSDQLSSRETWIDKTSVLRTLGKTVQNFRFVTGSLSSSVSGSGTATNITPPPESSPSTDLQVSSSSPAKDIRIAPPGLATSAPWAIPGLSLASWAGVTTFDADTFQAGSPHAGDTARRPVQSRDLF